jgi:hypothetical protein
MFPLKMKTLLNFRHVPNYRQKERMFRRAAQIRIALER